MANPRDGQEGGAAYLRDLHRVFDEYSCDTFLPVSSPFSAHFDALFLRRKLAEAKVLSNHRHRDDKNVTRLSSTNGDNTAQGSATHTAVGTMSRAANGNQWRFIGVLVGAEEEDTILAPGMTTDGEAETHFWGWWATKFFSQQDTSYLLR